MNNAWKLALGLVGCLIAIWVITASDNETYVVNYTAYKYNVNTDSMSRKYTKNCKVTVDRPNSMSGRRSKVMDRDILFEVWDYELSNSGIIVDSIDINVIQRVD